MNRVVKQWLAGLLAVGMAFTLLPAVAWAAADYDVAEGPVSLEGDGEYTLTGRTDANPITVTGGDVTLTLDNVSVTSADGCAFDIQAGNVTLILADESVNTFESGNHYAGIHVAEGASLTIRGSGALYATANKPSENTASGAGIGGNQTDDAGSITIESGTVVAKSIGDGAGIGGGHANDEKGKIYGKFQSITITGGTVTAASTGNGAGIGCGCWAKGMGAISITGGEVHAKSGSPDGRSYDIGYGHRDGDFESDISITGGVIFTEGAHRRGIGAGSVSQDDCLIFPYSGQGTCYGDPTLTGDITIPSGRTLTVPADSTLTVAEGATLTVAPGAALEVEGAVRNDGAIDQYGEIDGEVGGNPPVRYALTVTAPSFDSLAEGYDQPEAKPVTIENTGDGTVTLSQVELSGSDFTLGEGTVGPLAGGASNTTWTVRPAAGLECGHYEAEITVTCEDGVTAAATVSLDVLGAPVLYLDSDGAEQTRALYQPVKSGETTWREGWYVVRENVTVDSRITVSGDVHLILMDGCTLTVNGGIDVSEDNALTIYGQTAGTGRLEAFGSSMCGGIGSRQSRPCGTITINGGTIYAKGGQDGAGIGGGSFGDGGVITINGGNVTAEGGHDPSGYYMTGGAGIGGGRESRSGGTITINGGTVTATGCLDSAGIGGGGASGYGPSGGGSITITGGTVTATGGGDAPGIGGGRSTSGGTLGASGSFSTGEDGNAVVHTNNGIQDDSGKRGWGGVIFEGDSGTVYGSPTLTEDLEIQGGQTLTIPEGSTLTVAEGATLTNNGQIMNPGTLNNQGTVANNGRIVNDGGTTTGNDIAGAQPEKLAYSLRVSDITFENGADGARPEEKPIVIRNTGLNDVTIESVTVGEGFELTAGDVGALAAGAQNTSWKLRPQAGLFGGHTATITVTYSADGASQTATGEAAFTASGAGVSYQIPDAATLKAFRDYINRDSGHGRDESFVLTADIDLENEPWTPIGDEFDSFAGVFDGGGHTISGLYIDASDGEIAGYGLFGGNAGTIRGLTVSGAFTVSDMEQISLGGIVGMNEGAVADCASEGTVTIEGATISEVMFGYVGGIVGANMGTVTSCDSAARVAFTADGGDAYVVGCGMGGIVGVNADYDGQTAIENCRFSGQVTGAINGGAWTEIVAGIGGIVGINESMNGITVENCGNSGTVTGTIHGGVTEPGTGIGGIVGSNPAMGGVVRVKNCVNTGAVWLDASDISENAIGVGGIVGTNVSTDTASAAVENCCTSGQVTGTAEAVAGAVVGRNLVEDYSIDYESLMLLPGVAAGPSAVKTLRAGAPTALTDTVTNCYYLSGAAAGGIGEGDGQATEKSEAQFASGEVAWLLQNGQDSQAWGQTVGVGYPELTDSEDKTVFQITGEVAGQAPVVWYSNNKATLPAAEPSKAGVAFAGWSRTDGGGVDFAAGVAVSGDMTVYAVWKPPLAGSGTAEDPYLIPDKAALEAFRAYVNAWNECAGMYFKLTDDVDLEDELWMPIGDNYTSFNGVFDGGGHTISGVYINTPEYSNIGLFWSVSPEGAIKDLTVSGRVTGLDVVGGIVGYNYGRIENCHNAAAVTGDQDIGGVVGCNCGDVKNCYNTGTVSGNAGVGGVVGNNYAGVENCCNVGTVRGEDNAGGVVGQNTNDGRAQNGYYLDVCGAAGEGTAKTAEQFASGEVAWLLQNGQDSQAWGQALSADSYPVLTGEADKRVCKVTFRTESQGEYAVQYVNYNGRTALPAAPALAGLAFDHWSTENSADGERFDSATPVTGDITVYAVGRSTFGGESDEIMLTTTYGTALTADLSQYVRYASAPETPAAGKFTYTITAGNETLGAETAGGLLTIPGTADAGSYTLTIQAAEREPGYSLMSVESYGADPVTLTVTVTIAKADPEVTPPTPKTLTYTGAAQTLVTAGESNFGALVYSLTEAGPFTGEIPTATEAGTYTVYYMVEGSDNWNASPVGHVQAEIKKAASSATVTGNAGLVYSGAPQPLVASGASDTGTVLYALGENAETQPESGAFTETIPTGADAGTYYVWWKILGDVDHGDSEPACVPVTIAKADPVVTAPTPKTLTYTGAAQELVEAGSATGGTMQYSLDGTTYSAAIPTGTDAGAYTVWYKVTGDANHNDAAPQSVPVTIEKAEGRGSVTMADYLCGQTDVDPVAQLDTNGTEHVTYTYTVRGADDYRDTKPTTAGEYTVKALFPATDNYNAVTATADFKITHRLPSDLEEDAAFTCDCASELRLKEAALTQVPPGLGGLYGDVETLTRALADQVDTGANYAVFDVKLEVKEGAGAWHDAPEDSVPASGLTVTLPYPAGTNARYTFTAVHMFASGPRAGETETPAVTNTDQGITFTVTGLSPVCIGWTAPASSASSSRRGNYSVTLPAKSTGGAVTADSASARRGSAVTLTVTPDAGYHLDTLAVTDRSGGAVALADNGDGTYTFSMPAGPVAVEAEFTACGSARFADLDAAAWYHDYTDYVIARNLMQGVSTATFAPDQSTTRAMVVTILYRLEGEPGAPRNIAFADVAPGLWYTDAISWAAANGIVEGYSQDAFGPDDAITREQLATILYRYAAYKGADVSGQADLVGYTDASAVSDWAREGVTWAVQAGLLQGRSATTLVPTGTSTRAELAAVLARYAQATEEPDQTKA